MAQGLECWDAQGRLIFGTGDSITKVIGTVQTQVEVAGSVTVPEMEGGTRPFVSKNASPPGGAEWRPYGRTEIFIEGRTIRWTAGRPAISFVYGVY
jgi:hypothetical protein